MALGHAIMTALLEDDLSGYELAKDFETSLGFFWQASHQQIYQELRKLSDKHWLSKREVNQRGKPNKIVYGITREGREALAQWVFSSTDRKSTRLNSSHDQISYAVFCLKKKKKTNIHRCNIEP